MFGIVLVSPSFVISMQNEVEYPVSESALALMSKGLEDSKTISGGATLEQSADFILISSRLVHAFGLPMLVRSKLGRMVAIPFNISNKEFWRLNSIFGMIGVILFVLKVYIQMSLFHPAGRYALKAEFFFYVPSHPFNLVEHFLLPDL